MILEIIALFSYVALVTLLFRPPLSRRLAPYSMVLVGQILSLVSLIMIESGAWIMEQSRFGYENGSFWLYLLFCLVSLIGFLMGSVFVDLRSLKSEPSAERENEFYILSLLMLMFVIFYGYGAYHTQGVAGYGRRTFLLYTYPARILTFMSVAMNALGWYGIFRLDQFWKKAVFALLYAVAIKFAGDEFGGFLTITILVFISLAIFKNIGIKKVLIGGFLAGCAASSVKIIITAHAIHNGGGFFEKMNSSIRFARDRLAEQAHVFWYSVNLWSGGKSVDVGVLQWLSDFFRTYYFENIHYGVGRLMWAINPALTREFFENGTVFATGLPDIAIISAGLVVALGLVFLGSVIYAQLFFFVIKVARLYSFILFLLLFRLFGIFNEFYYSGDFGFINVKIVAYIAIFVILYFGFRRFFKNVFLINWSLEVKDCKNIKALDQKKLSD